MRFQFGAKDFGAFPGLVLQLRRLSLLLIALTSLESHAGVTVKSGDFPAWDLKEICEMLLDTNSVKPISQIVSTASRQDWASCRDQSLSRGYSKETVWLKFSLNNVDRDLRTIYLHLPAPWLSDIRVYSRATQNDFEERLYGAERPFKERGVQAGGFFIPLHLSPNEESRFYVRISSRGALTIGGQVLSESDATQINLMNTLFVGFLVGGISLLALFSFFIFILLKDRNYFNYVLFNLSMLLLCGTIYGYTYQYLWPELVEFNFKMNSATVAFSTITILVFSRRFLAIPELAPAADKGLVWLLAIGWLGLLLSFSSYYYSVVITVVTALASAALVYIVILGVYAWRRRVAAAGYFLIAWTASISGMALIALMAQGVFEYSSYNHYALGIGALMEMALLSIALAGRIQVLQLEKNQAQIDLAKNLDRSRLDLEKKVVERTIELETATQKAEMLARTDPLTGLNNRRAFFDYGEVIGRQRRASVAQYAVAMIDLDHFKAINDRYGHRVGDETLQKVAKTILLNMREADIAGRIGGEEFAIILPRTSVEAAAQLAERLRLSIAEIVVYGGVNEVRLTASIGVAECISADVTLEDTLNRADQALYKAKESGRDCVLVI